jgi:DNA-binding MarR family transcriptional regulator
MNQVTERNFSYNSPTSIEEFAELDSLQQQLDKLRRKLSSPAAHRPNGLGSKDIKRLAREMVRSRRRRDAVFGGGLFSDPAWDILLELYLVEMAQHRVNITQITSAIAAPPTTALRWLERLAIEGWISREPDMMDRRRIWVSLTERGSMAMREYFESVTLRAA